VATLRNVYACLVHEQFECVLDLVRNLRYFDPLSPILLYNGGTDQGLLTGPFPFERYGAVVHPSPQPTAWGRLHAFAVDSMAFALDNIPFDTLTIVDSDQLATRGGYTACLEGTLAGRSGIGLLGNAPAVQPRHTAVPAPASAFRELDLWRPFLRRFPRGEEQFPRWCFWPATVFTVDAARELTRLFAGDPYLRSIMGRTQICATEEIILPTLVALTGLEVSNAPFSYDFVKYRAPYSSAQITAALENSRVFWLHPVARRYQHELRTFMRTRHAHYRLEAPPQPRSGKCSPIPRSLPVPLAMKQVEGWLEEDEASLLLAAAARSLETARDRALVEVGSYCGRATVVLGHAVTTLGAAAKVYAIDPLDGCVGALDQGLLQLSSTSARFHHNIRQAGLADVVESIPKRSSDVTWERPIGLLLIDGLHDYVNVARDFYRFEPWLTPDSLVAFHDYAGYYPGVQAFVDDLVTRGDYEIVDQAQSLIILGRTGPARPVRPAAPLTTTMASVSGPLVSCIMATADRATFVPQAIHYFQRQDYPHRELIVIDDGRESVASLIPDDPRIRYLRLDERRTMGFKHNLACELARGEIMCHWDDDDWNADRRLSYQLTELSHCPVMTLSGLSHLLYYEPTTGTAAQYIYPADARPWVSGNTLCYRKEFWQHHRFPDMNEGADTLFVWSLVDAKVQTLADHTFFVAIIHAANTSPKRTQSAGWHACTTQEVRSLFSNDCAFYDQWRRADGRQPAVRP
jgi:hypothetical protein